MAAPPTRYTLEQWQALLDRHDWQLSATRYCNPRSPYTTYLSQSINPGIATLKPCASLMGFLGVSNMKG